MSSPDVSPDPRRHAAALAYVLLASSWREDTTRRLVRKTLVAPVPAGDDRSESSGEVTGVEAVVRLVHERFPRPPLDAPRELIRALESDEALRDLLRRRAPRPVLRPPGTATTRSPWELPRIDDVTALADHLRLGVPQLLWLADPQRRLRTTRAGPLHGYERVWLRRGDRVPRLLEAPTPVLRRVQRDLLAGLVGGIPTHPAVHGFVRGRNVLSHARLHQHAPLLVTLDLRSFFAAVRNARVRGVFRTAGYPEPVAELLADLTTTATPVRVLSGMPAGGDPDARYRLRAALRVRHLAQGAGRPRRWPTPSASPSTGGWPATPRRAGCATAATPTTSPSRGRL